MAVLRTERLRQIFAAAIGPEADAAGYSAALVKRGMLPADDTPLSAASLAVAVLAVLSGDERASTAPPRHPNSR
jgi:hypothetical protein